VQVPLLFGEAIHKGRQVLSESAAIEAALEAFDNIYTTAYESHELSETAHTPYVGRSLLRAYHQKWPAPNDLVTEMGFNIEVPGANASLMGRVDYVADDGLNSVVDVKTTSSTFWLPQARLNWQLVGYAYALRELQGLNAERVGIDALIVSAPSQKLLKLELPEHEYALRLFDNLHRRYGSVQPRDYEEWHRWFLHTTSVIRQCIENDWWPMRAPKACNRFGRTCEYDLLCKATDEQQESEFIQRFFKQEVWHPYE
jgi:hypothetical protein